MSCSLVTPFKVSTPSSKTVPVKLRIKKTTAYPMKAKAAINIMVEPVRTDELSCAMLSPPFQNLILSPVIQEFAAKFELYAELSRDGRRQAIEALRSEEHTSELQSRSDLVCRLLL